MVVRYINIESLSIETSKDVALFEGNVVILLVYRLPDTDMSLSNDIVNKSFIIVVIITWPSEKH